VTIAYIAPYKRTYLLTYLLTYRFTLLVDIISNRKVIFNRYIYITA